MSDSGAPAQQQEVVDLTAEDQDGYLPRRAFTLKSRDLEPGRDKVRAVLAIGLSVLLSIVTVGALVAVSIDPSLEKPIIEVLKLTFTPVVGLVGSAIGFYFGASASGTSDRP